MAAKKTDRIYVVTEASTANQRLIRGISQQSVVGFVTRNAFTARPATPDEVALLVSTGTKVEDSRGAGTPVTPPSPPAQGQLPGGPVDQEPEPEGEDGEGSSTDASQAEPIF